MMIIWFLVEMYGMQAIFMLWLLPDYLNKLVFLMYHWSFLKQLKTELKQKKHTAHLLSVSSHLSRNYFIHCSISHLRVARHKRVIVNPAPNTVAVDKGNCKRFLKRFLPFFATKLAEFSQLYYQKWKKIKIVLLIMVI